MNYLGYIIAPHHTNRNTEPKLYRYIQTSSSIQRPTQSFDNSFWQQLPQATALGHLHYDVATGHYRLYLSHLDVMGSKNFRGGALSQKKGKATPIKSTSTSPIKRPSPPPPEIIDVYVSGSLVGSVPRSTLTRFSFEAALCFPKPGLSSSNKQQRSPVANVVGSSRDGTNNGLHLTSRGTAEDPTVDAVKVCLDWMASNSGVQGNFDDLVPLAPEDIDTFSTEVMIDVYAAAWCLKMRPANITINPLRAAIMERLTNNKPTVDLLALVHAHIPDIDSVHTRAVTAYFEWLEGTLHGRLSGAENSEICEYIKADKYLNQKFYDVQQSRRQKKYHMSKAAKAAKRAAAEKELQKGWEAVKDAMGTDTAADDTSDVAATTASVDTTTPSVPSNSSETESNGKGVGGKHVPGA
ncbi:hypothetical protein LTR86_004254 [Recurvomyces mirabilis]|nr:hypothetical protein LTR86_004254 [Recurvomyces mirabilis]